MKKILKGNMLLIFLLTFILIVGSLPAWGDSTNDDNDQTNTSGSNTQITGGYTATTTNNNDGQTNTTTSISGGVSTLGFGASIGKHVRDLNCERIKLSKVLFDYGMKVAAVSILCQDERVFEAMLMAGTPCPFEGKIGNAAIEQWNKYDVERPDYKSYVSKLETRSQIDDELEEIERQKQAIILAEEKAKRIAELETLKAEEELSNIIVETDIEIKENVIIRIHK